MTDLVRRELTQTDLLRELEPVVATELDRHLSVAKEWFPHDYVPWSEGRNFAFLGGEDWSPADSKLDEVAKTALVVNLLTEDNLPSDHPEIDESLGRDGAWGQWTGRWTAEEGRHAVALRDYLTVTRAVDPVQLERERMVHMSAGFQSAYDLDMLHSVAYVSFQELATRISHRNTGKSTGDPIADQLLARISVDENLHMIFYRNLLAAAIELAPDDAMVAIRDVVLQFQMPGHTIEGFTRRSLQIAMAGIYDLRIHHDDVISPVLRHWKVWDLENLSAEGEQAREELATFLAGLDAQASRFVEKREAKRARDAARSS
ncbi:MAG: acyl-ACP desaturase [Motilibacteraceae bacterium]